MLVLLALIGLFLLPGPWNVIVLALAVLFELGEIVFWRKFLRRYRIRSGPETMVGAVAEVVVRCDRSAGLVRLRGDLWQARCDSEAEPGDRVEVREVNGLTLRVTLIPASAPRPTPAPESAG